MAIELGSKIVKHTKEYSNYAIGISLPLQIGNTAFEQTFTTFEQVKSNIKNLLLTKRGERVMQPNFGSGLQELLFEQNVDDLEDRLQTTIEDSISQWLPFVNIDEIDIEQTDELRDSNRVNVSIKFTVGNSVDLNEVTFTAQG